jgi:3-hydroxyisobutyrate dehydrogenase-like beta-hydroxyacid dehydrogenase
MSKIAFLGLGMMGSPMARRLIEAGNGVTVWNRTQQRTEPFRGIALGVAETPASAVGGAEFVITMVSTPEALEKVLFGADGVAVSISEGQLWIDMSTVGPDEFRAAASRMPAGVETVDAPVRGSVPEATEGRLQVFVGSEDRVFDRVHSLLGSLGNVRHVGPPGSGASMKLVVNLTLGAAMVAFGEAVALGSALGLDTVSVMDALAESPIAGVVRSKRENVEASRYPPSFKLELAAKDMTLVHQAAGAAGLDLPESDAAGRWLEAAVADGSGERDISAVIATILRQVATVGGSGA